jgi:hypothetical protein
LLLSLQGGGGLRQIRSGVFKKGSQTFHRLYGYGIVVLTMGYCFGSAMVCLMQMGGLVMTGGRILRGFREPFGLMQGVTSGAPKCHKYVKHRCQSNLHKMPTLVPPGNPTRSWYGCMKYLEICISYLAEHEGVLVIRCAHPMVERQAASMREINVARRRHHCLR